MDVMESSRLTASESHDMLVGPNSYGRVLPNNSVLMPNSAGMISGMHLSFNTMPSFVLKPSDSSTSVYQGDGSPGMRPGSGLGFMGEPLKKKRGRPRKYERDGTMALSWTPLPSASGYCSTPSLEPPSKRQGCPPVSGKKQQLDALGSSRIAFTVHIITVNPGEDVASKIMAFSQQGPHTVCILSANGVISNVTLRQPATSGGTVIYEGRFEIISLSGSFLLTENGVIHTRTGGLSVALSGSDGHVVGGAVSGMLMAATPVQVTVGSFIAEAKTDPLKHEPSPAAPKMAACFRGASATPPSEGTSSESFEDDDPGSSPPNQSAGTCYNNFSPQVPKLSEYISFSWSHSAVK